MHMDIGEFFQSPSARIAAFADAQLHLYRHDKSLQDYFMMLQLDSWASPRVRSDSRSAKDQLISWLIQGADKINRFRGRPKLKADVLFCPMPDLSRKTEQQFLIRILLGLAQTDATILCLLPARAPFRSELDAQLAAMGRSGQITFVDPLASLSRLDARLNWRFSRVRAQTAFRNTVEILEPYGLNPGLDVQDYFQDIAPFVEAWERMAPWVEFDAVVARCHWQPLCSPVCRTAQQRGKPVITFQQGVITHTLDVPVTASTYVAFGQSSASFLDRLNHRFFQAVGKPVSPVQYISGGSLFDTVTALPDQFDQRTLLVVDVPPPNGQGDFYGLESQCRALLEVTERLLTSEVPLNRVVIRPHPHWGDLNLEACQRLVREHSDRCELSHPSWSLDFDLRRSSVVLGIFSGVLTIASASGLPTFFLRTEQGFVTRDLECFSPHQTLLPDDAFHEIARVLTDKRAYAAARKIAQENARGYYTNGANLDFGLSFFERLLRGESTISQLEHSMP
jgi:hypothetical protein